MINNNSLSDVVAVSSVFIGCCKRDPVSLATLSAQAIDKVRTVFENIPFYYLKKYIDGVLSVEDDLGGACRLSDKLFTDSKRAMNNAIRIIHYVTNIDEIKKIDWFINATRALLLGGIETSMLFRIFYIIDNTLAEDLEYMSTLIEKDTLFRGNIQIQALVQSGLLISAGIDANSGVEDQEYAITRLGYLVDQFALSLNNDERQHWYKDLC